MLDGREVLVDGGDSNPRPPACKRSSKNQVSAASGVAYTKSSAYSHPLNWTEVGPTGWGEPLRWHKFLGHSFRFCKSALASSSRRRGLGKGTAFESPSPAALSKSFRRCRCWGEPLRWKRRPHATHWETRAKLVGLRRTNEESRNSPRE
jgi:hypothetical protein